MKYAITLFWGIFFLISFIGSRVEINKLNNRIQKLEKADYYCTIFKETSES